MRPRRSSSLWLLLVLMVSARLCYGRSAIALRTASETGDEWTIEGRSLKIKVDDYDDATWNHGHDPPPTNKKTSNSRSSSGKNRGGDGGRSGRRG